jgi:hypothetical protein
MAEEGKLFLLVRFLAAGGGLIGGAISGTILVILLLVITGSNFGLTNIWPATVAGAVIGTVLGFLFPRVGKSLIELFVQLPVTSDDPKI